MASTINSTTSSGVVITSDNTGQLQLQSAGTTIMTVTPTGVTTQVGAPAFSAYVNNAQSIPSTSWTVVAYNTELFDTNNNYNSSTYRFTPTVAGYYQINATLSPSSSTITSNNNAMSIWKNGTEFIRGAGFAVSSGNLYMQVSGIVSFNGTTDYIEILMFQTSAGTLTTQTGTFCNFNGCFLRSL